MDLQQTINLFLGNYIDTTRNSYEFPLRAMQNWVGPARPVNTVSPILLIEFVQSIRNRPDVRSPATVNKYIKTMRTFFNWCVRTGLIDSSPAASLKYLPAQKAVDREKAMPDALYEQLLDRAKWEARSHALVLFLGDTGCRIGGAAGLRWHHVDLSSHSAKVTEKGSKSRMVYYGEECGKALERWRHTHTGDETSFVFQRSGEKITSAALGQYFRRLCLSAGIGSWGPHSIRHRKGYQITDNRISPAIGAKVLGNTLKIFLEYYAADDQERIQAAVAELSHRTSEKAANVVDFRAKTGSEH